MEWLLGIGLLALSSQVSAQIPGATYRCVDDAGRSTYTNTAGEMVGRKCVIVSREVSVVPADAIGANSTSSPPPATGQAGLVWSRPNSTDEQFNQDRAQCIAQAYSAPDDNRLMVLAACLRGKGWTTK